MMKKNKILMFIPISLTIICLLTVTYAWLVSTIKAENVIEIITPNIPSAETNKVQAKLYTGIDFDKNGTLDPWYDGNSAVDEGEKTKNEILAGKYTEIENINSTVFPALIPSKMIQFKLVIKNESLYPIRIDTYFDNLNVANNQLKLLFKLSNLSIVNYKLASYTGELSRSLIEGTDYSFVSISKHEYFVYDLKQEERFLQDVVLPSNYVMEIDYSMVAISYNEAYEHYLSFIKYFYDNKFDQICRKAYNEYLLIYQDNSNFSSVSTNLNNLPSVFNSNNGSVISTALNGLITDLTTLNSPADAILTELINCITQLNSLNVTTYQEDCFDDLQLFKDKITTVYKFTIEKIFINVEFLTGQ